MIARRSLLLIEKSRRIVDRQKPKEAILGDGAGNIYADGMYFCRWPGPADENGNATFSAPFRAFGGTKNFIEQNNRGVYIRQNHKGQNEIDGPIYEDLQAAGIKPSAMHPNSPYRQFVRLDDIQNFKAIPLGKNSMKVRVGELFYVDRNGVPRFFPGSIAVATANNPAVHVDLTSSIPATLDYECFALISFNQDEWALGNNPLEVSVSTAQTSLPSTLDITDIQQAYAGMADYALPIKAFHLKQGMTGLGGNRSKDLEGRQLINVPTPSTIASLSPLTTKGDLFTYSTVNDRLPVGADGTLLVADSGETTGLKYETAANVINPVLLAPGPIGSTTPNTIAGTTGSLIAADAATNTPTTVITLGHNTSGTPAAGYGTKLLFHGESSTTPDVDMAGIRSVWTTATHASRSSSLIFSTWAVGVETDVLTITPAGIDVIGVITGTREILTNTGTTANITTLTVSQTGAVVGTGYAAIFEKTGASTTNVGLYVNATGGTSNYAAIFNNGQVGIGTITPLGRLDLCDGFLSFVVGANNFSTTRTNNTLKSSRTGGYHYVNAEEPVGLLFHTSDASNNVVAVGGGSSSLNAATQVSIYTAANTTTQTGTERVRIDSAGNVGMGITPTVALHVVKTDTAGANITTIQTIGRESSGAGVAGYGTSTLYTLKSSTNAGREAASFDVTWITATDASRASQADIAAYYTTTKQVGFSVRGDTGGVKTSVNGATPIARQTAGAATAGATYTATEQTMLQVVYDAVRAFGITT